MSAAGLRGVRPAAAARRRGRSWAVVVSAFGCLVVSLAVALNFRWPQRAARVPAVAIAPTALHLTGLDRPDVTLAGLRGRVVVLNVWATWCAPCRREMPSLQRLARQVDAARVAVLAVSVEDDAHQVREWLRQSGITLDVYLDPGGRVAQALPGLAIYPMTYLIDEDGGELARVAGAHAWDEPALAAALLEPDRDQRRRRLQTLLTRRALL